MRPAWSGFLRLSLVTVPVQAFNAQEPGEQGVTLHRLHGKCHSRIRNKMVCPIHGEVTQDEIVSGYEFAPNQYVIIDKEEIDDLVPDAKGIEISTFIPPAAVDPLYYDGRTYYLAPEGATGASPYALLCEAMREENRWALAEAVLWGRNRQMIIRPVDKVLVMSFMQFGSQIRKPMEIPDAKVKPAEVKLARRLVAESTEERVNWEKRHDEQGDALHKLIKAKIAGKKIVAEEPDEPRPVINIMDALTKSLRRDTRRSKGTKSGKNTKHERAPRHHVAAHRVRKSS